MTTPTATAAETAPATDIGQCFADFAVGVRYEQLPAPAVTAAKKTILDSLAVMLAASGTEPAVRAVVDLVQESGGRPEASVLGFGFKAPAIMAAFANGAMAHSLNYDDQLPWGQHPSLSIVPAALAITERRSGVSGRDLLAAIAAGQDIFTRLRCNVDWRKDWNLSTVMGVFAATATAGRLLGLSREQMRHAFAAASMQSSGVMAVVSGPGSELGGIYGAFPAKGAVTAALLAEKGMVGVEAVFESKLGIFSTYFDGRYDRDAMLAGLGTDFTGAVTLYKPWAAIGTAHSHIHATIEVASREDLDVDEIDEFRVYTGDCHEILCTPLDARRAPGTLLDARFSLPFLVAFAAVRRALPISEFTADKLSDPRVLAVARKVVPIRDPTLDWKFELPHGRIEIIMRDGRRLDWVGDNVPGSAAAPMTWDDVARKFEDCASAAAVPAAPGDIRRAQRIAQDLESVEDATDLLRVISGALPLSD
jgi:2-methylcitrate dehydratase PrpD